MVLFESYPEAVRRRAHGRGGAGAGCCSAPAGHSLRACGRGGTQCASTEHQCLAERAHRLRRPLTVCALAFPRGSFPWWPAEAAQGAVQAAQVRALQPGGQVHGRHGAGERHGPDLPPAQGLAPGAACLGTRGSGGARGASAPVPTGNAPRGPGGGAREPRARGACGQGRTCRSGGSRMHGDGGTGPACALRPRV